MKAISQLNSDGALGDAICCQLSSLLDTTTQKPR
jgi:hypothetical protein